jgi:hypothetical protein
MLQYVFKASSTTTESIFSLPFSTINAIRVMQNGIAVQYEKQQIGEGDLFIPQKAVKYFLLDIILAQLQIILL